MAQHKKCEVCGRKDFHVHKQKVITEFFLPTPENPICHCGSVAHHDHKREVITHIHCSDVLEKYLG